MQCSRVYAASRYEAHLIFLRRLSIFVALVVYEDSFSLGLSFQHGGRAFFVPFDVLGCLEKLFSCVVFVWEILRQKQMSTKVLGE